MIFKLLLLAPILLGAFDATLTIDEHNSIHNYNNKPTLKMAKKRKMHKLHKIDEDEVKKIVKQTVKEDVIYMRLTHSKNIL